ncbi:MAG: hypothetical protein KAT79_04705 [candidate division Zixibacteria bacterium]|nr:hypothetical protein [candidate division Zixibacteria bacterium]
MNSAEFVFNDSDSITTTGEKNGELLKIKVGESEFDLRPLGGDRYSTVLNGAKAAIAVVKHKGVYYIDCDSVLLEVKEPSENDFGGAAGDHGAEKDKILAPMPGKIVKIFVAVGDEVDVKQPMVVVEAMKMENQVNSKAKGKVKVINFAEGDQVDTEKPIIELELEPEE